MNTTHLALSFLLLATLLQAAEEPIRVTCVGDSITAGEGARGPGGQDNSYPAQLAGRLGAGYTVANFGVGGTTLLAAGDKPWTKTPQFAAARASRPDIVIIMLGTNDTKPANWSHQDAFTTDYRALIAQFQTLPSAPLVVLCTPIPAFPGKWGIDAGRLHDGVAPRVRALATELSLPLIDLHATFAGQSALVPDTVHPNAAGYTLMAHTVGDALLGLAAVATEPAGIPDALKDQAGKPVRATDWKRRRAEILELFRTNVYGRAPLERPADLSFVPLDAGSEAMDGKATRKQVEIRFSGPGGTGRIRVLAFIPKSPRPAPGFLLLCHREDENIDPTRTKRRPFWSAEEIVARGYAAITFPVADCDPDRNDRFKDGVHGIYDPPGARAKDAWATIAAWAWGASRVMDYLATDRDIDASRIAVVGHSRGGKAALWAGAQDERFAMVISNNSGCTGAALARGTTGETVARINRVFPHWFCENYKAFSDAVDTLPVDQHQLLALIAPRLLYVASASADANAWPAGEFQACRDASPVFRLLGGQGLAAAAMPAPGGVSHEGGIGYHLRVGEHDLKLEDWNRFMDFADLKWPKR